MAYSELLGDRIRQVFQEKQVTFEEKKMMGGLCFMVDAKMCLGIVKEELMARIGSDNYGEALKKPGCKEMNFTGRAMKGYVFIEAEVVDLNTELEYWVQLCIDFNPLAKASPKKLKSPGKPGKRKVKKK